MNFLSATVNDPTPDDEDLAAARKRFLDSAIIETKRVTIRRRVRVNLPDGFAVRTAAYVVAEVTARVTRIREPGGFLGTENPGCFSGVSFRPPPY